MLLPHTLPMLRAAVVEDGLAGWVPGRGGYGLLTNCWWWLMWWLWEQGLKALDIISSYVQKVPTAMTDVSTTDMHHHRHHHHHRITCAVTLC